MRSNDYYISVNVKSVEPEVMRIITCTTEPC